jgi:hypothetical protein
MTDLVKYQEVGLSVQETMSIGKLFAESGFFSDSRGAAQAVTKIMAGKELGIPPVAAMTGIHVIKGKIAVGANLIAAKIKASGKYNYRVREMTDKLCAIEFFEGKESIGLSTFTIEDARKADTQNLNKFARNMLFARAISNGAKWYTPDIFVGPIYTPEELGAAIDDEGSVVEIQPQPSAPDPRVSYLKRIEEINNQLAQNDRLWGHDDFTIEQLTERGKELKNRLNERNELLSAIDTRIQQATELNYDIEIPPAGNLNALDNAGLRDALNDLTIAIQEEREE